MPHHRKSPRETAAAAPAAPTPLPPLTPPTRTQAFLRELPLIALLVVVFIAHLVTIRPGLDWGDDFAIYISHAINLANGHAYANTNYLVNPFFTSYAPAAYPPGFPLLLAPLVKLFPPAQYVPDLFPFKLFVTLSLIASLWLIDRLMREDLPTFGRLPVLAVFALSPYILGFKNAIVSDLPFVAISFLALLLARRAEREGLAYKDQLTRSMVAALVMFAAAQTRSIGAVLPIAFVLAQLLRYRHITTAAGTVFLTYAAAASIFVWLKVSSDSYFSVLAVYFDDFFAMMTAQLQLIPRFHMTAMGDIWLTPWRLTIADVPAGRLLMAPCLLLAGMGLILRLRAGARTPELYFILYYAVLLIYPTPQDYRLLIPIVPLFFFYVAVAFKKLSATRFKPLALGAASALVAFTLLCLASSFSGVQRHSVATDLTAPQAQEAIAFLRTHTAPTDRILCSKPRAIALFAARPATPIIWAEDEEYAWNQVREMRPQYFLLGRQFIDDENTFQPWVRHYKDVFLPVFENHEYSVFRIVASAVPKAKDQK